MTSVCRICLAGNTSLQALKNNHLISFYEKLTSAKFHSEDARPRVLCCFCYQKLLRCHTFSQMAVRSEKIFNHLYESGLEVTNEYITEVKLNMKQHLSVATNVGSQVTIIEEPLPTDIDIKEEVTTEPDTLLEVEYFPKECIKNQLTFKDDIRSEENDVDQLLSNTRIDQSKPDDSSFTIKDEPISSIDIKEEVTPELDELVEIEFFPEHCTRSRSTFVEDSCDQKDAEELLHTIHLDQTKQDHSKKQFSCKYCNNIFYIKSNLISHIRNSHSLVVGNQFSSTKKHTETTGMIADRSNHSQKEISACHECDKTFERKSRFIRHIGSHKREKSFACVVCDKKYNRNDRLLSHMRTHTGEKPFACHVCDKQFNVQSNLVAHERIHMEVKPFACQVCDKQFTYKSNLVSHMRTHTGEKPFGCDICNKHFNQHSHLASHMRTHTGEKPFACNVCDKQFKIKSSLVSHMRTHTGEKPFACYVCDKQFNDKCNLVTHMTTHTGEKPFACNVCDKQFNRKDRLVTHMRTHATQKHPKPESSRGRDCCPPNDDMQ